MRVSGYRGRSSGSYEGERRVVRALMPVRRQPATTLWRRLGNDFHQASKEIHNWRTDRTLLLCRRGVQQEGVHLLDSPKIFRNNTKCKSCAPGMTLCLGSGISFPRILLTFTWENQVWDHPPSGSSGVRCEIMDSDNKAVTSRVYMVRVGKTRSFKHVVGPANDQEEGKTFLLLDFAVRVDCYLIYLREGQNIAIALQHLSGAQCTEDDHTGSHQRYQIRIS